MCGVLADITRRNGQIAGELMLDREVPLLDDGRLQNVREHADTPARQPRDRWSEYGESITDLRADEPVIVLQEKVINIRWIHRQAAVCSGGFEVIQNSVSHAHHVLAMKTVRCPSESEPRLKSLLVRVIKGPAIAILTGKELLAGA